VVVGGGCVVGGNGGEKSHSGCADLKAASLLKFTLQGLDIHPNITLKGIMRKNPVYPED